MSFTDQAFIKAYQTDAVAPPAAAPTRTHESHTHGPHAKFAAPKRAPLSEAIAREDAPERPLAEDDALHTPSIAGVVVQCLPVPSTPRHLAEECGDAYRRMMAYAGRSGEVIGFLGAGAGAGCTTTTLAAGLAVAHSNGPVALVDGIPGKRALCESLGLVSTQTIAAAVRRGRHASESMVHAIEQGVSVGVAFDTAAGGDEGVSSALRAMTATHAAVLVDLGSDVESIATHPARGADSLRLDAIVIVRQSGRGEADVMFARRVLAASGHTVVGVIESFC